MFKRDKGFYLNGILSLLFIVIVAAGCSKPPTKEMADAEAALAAAKLAEADLYVPDEYKSAEERLAQARAELESKEYEEARKAALESTTLSNAARDHAISAKQRAKVEAEDIINQLKAALKEAESAGADRYFAEDKNKVARTLGEMEADYQAEKYLDVIKKGREAITFAKNLTNMSRLRAEEDSRRKAAEEVLLARQRAEEEAAKRRAEEETARLRVEEEARRKAAEEAAALAAALAARTHTVEKGECLWRISESDAAYNDPFQWPLIYQANRDQIKDPDLIFPRQEFKINKQATTDEVAKAKRFAQNRGPWSLYDGK
ncbi:MAG: DUF4398 domain-containing protein [Candidatus Schekmanbacteria bacterium]|nr:DUF4398 domain-containing protein [Candidatus Schekmanbacteria bacterium]